jgi:glycerol-3-phosphate acyltransferase PlsY
MIALKYLAVIFIGYALGSVSFGLIGGKLFRGLDVRDYGSGKTGGTNVLRSAGVRAAVFAMVLDVVKAGVPVLIAWIILHSHAAQLAAGLAAMAGHNWPIFAGFRGGRGVSAYVGSMMVMYWPVGVMCGPVLGFGIAGITRYVSLGSICVAFSSCLVMLVLAVLGEQPVEYAIFAAVGGGLILLSHRDNIQRLCAGTERKLGERAERRAASPHSTG